MARLAEFDARATLGSFVRCIIWLQLRKELTTWKATGSSVSTRAPLIEAE